MKFTKIVLLVSVICCLASCKKENTPPTILGKWNLINFYDKETPSLGTETFRSGSYFLFSEKEITIYSAIDQDPFETDTLEYTKTGNKIAINDPIAGTYLQITTLTANKLILDVFDEADDFYNGTIELNR